MSGHNKWSQTKHKKDITDAKKSKIFSKLVRFISVEAKLSGGKDSPGLRAAIEKAKKVNMPAENIERAIKKAAENFRGDHELIEIKQNLRRMERQIDAFENDKPT